MCACSSCSSKKIGRESENMYFRIQEFATEYSPKMHEQRIIDAFNSCWGKRCIDAKIVYSLQEEPRFYVVHFFEKKIVIKTHSITGEETKELFGEYEEKYGAGFIYNEKYFLMNYCSVDSERSKDIKAIFEEYRDKKVYNFYACEFAYENEEGKKTYIGDDEWFIENKLGGQREIKEKYYKKLDAFVLWFNRREIDENHERASAEETGFVLEKSGCAG